VAVSKSQLLASDYDSAISAISDKGRALARAHNNDTAMAIIDETHVMSIMDIKIAIFVVLQSKLSTVQLSKNS
jgi:hypothetical protein